MAADLEWLREAGVAYFMASSFRERIEKSAARFTNLSPICEAVFDGVGGSTAGSGFCEWIDEDTGRLLEIEDFEWGDERGEGPAVGLYSETDGERWITEYEGSLCKAFAFDPAFLLEGDLHRRVGIAEETIRKWIQEGDCGEVGGSSGGSQAPLQ